MTEYAMLILPAANKVYARSSLALMQSETAVFNEAVLAGRLQEMRQTTLGGIPYLTFSANDLSSEDVRFLSNLSSLYALFERKAEWQRPLELCPLDRFDSDLLTIQKYAGKTNEHFTKLLLNVTMLASAFAREMLERKWSVFDPLCGRGTALNQALMFGFDAAGMEIDTRDFDAYRSFLKTWLESKRIKHRAELRGRKDRRFGVALSANKEHCRAGDELHVSMVNADTLRGLEFFKRASFDVIVLDAPYGVREGAHLGRGSPSRSPVELLASALPIWRELLRPGGAIGIGWNARMLPRSELHEMLTGAGFAVCDSGAYLGFEHRVDQVIVRDILVARRSVDHASSPRT